MLKNDTSQNYKDCSWALSFSKIYYEVPSIHNNGIAVVVLQLVNQATCFGRFTLPSSGLQSNIVN